MNYICEKDKCTGCSACVAICPKNAISIIDSVKSYNAVINNDACIHCNACHKVCQVNRKPLAAQPIEWLQGWSNNPRHRHQSSSGGAALEIEKAFILEGGHVWTCLMKQGEFVFSEVKEVEQLKKFIGSKYVKSNPLAAYREIRTQLKHEKVLFVGLPCQVSGLKKFLGEKENKNLYTVDLICHGTPSPKLLELFLNQYHHSLRTASNIAFRKKTSSGTRFEVCDSKIYFSTPGTCDTYTMGFLEGLFYTENCYQCAYANTNRVSDITLGDFWGSNLSPEEQKSGISLILVQNEKGKELLRSADLSLQAADKSLAVSNNHQLASPMPYHRQRDRFFKLIKHHRFNYAIFRCLPVFWLKQKVKSILIRLKIMRGGNSYQVIIEK